MSVPPSGRVDERESQVIGSVSRTALPRSSGLASDGGSGRWGTMGMRFARPPSIRMESGSAVGPLGAAPKAAPQRGDDPMKKGRGSDRSRVKEEVVKGSSEDR